jgi:hypothetical protein
MFRHGCLPPGLHSKSNHILGAGEQEEFGRGEPPHASIANLQAVAPVAGAVILSEVKNISSRK